MDKSDAREEAAARDDVMARLARSRAELRALLEPAEFRADAGRPGAPGAFPRSYTMRMLTSKRGAGAVAAVGVGLLLSRPAVALRLIKMIPLGGVIRMLLLRLFTGSGAQYEPKRER